MSQPQSKIVSIAHKSDIWKMECVPKRRIYGQFYKCISNNIYYNHFCILFYRASQENLKLLAQIQSNTQETRKLHAEKLSM